MNQGSDEIFTLDEASQFAKMSKNTLRSMILSGKLRGVEIGVGHQRRHYRIVKRDLLAFFGINTANHGESGGAGQAMSPGRAPALIPVASSSRRRK